MNDIVQPIGAEAAGQPNTFEELIASWRAHRGLTDAHKICASELEELLMRMPAPVQVGTVTNATMEQYYEPPVGGLELRAHLIAALDYGMAPGTPVYALPGTPLYREFPRRVGA